MAAETKGLVLLKDALPTDLILGLYATGLLVNESSIHDSRALFLDRSDVLQKLSSLFNFSKSYYEIDNKGSNYSQKRMLYVLSHFDAFRFLFQPLAVYVISARKEILSVPEAVSCNTYLEIIPDVFKQYVNVFLHYRKLLDLSSISFQVSGFKPIDLSISSPLFTTLLSYCVETSR